MTSKFHHYAFIHLAVCLTAGPKPFPNRALHIVRSRASSFNCEYPLLSLSSSSSFPRFLPRLPVTSIPPLIFPSITRCRRQFLRKMWPIQLAFHFLISCRIFLCSLTLYPINIFNFQKLKIQSKCTIIPSPLPSLRPFVAYHKILIPNVLPSSLPESSPFLQTTFNRRRSGHWILVSAAVNWLYSASNKRINSHDTHKSRVLVHSSVLVFHETKCLTSHIKLRTRHGVLNIGLREWFATLNENEEQYLAGLRENTL